MAHEELLAAHDAQLRAWVPDPPQPGETIEWDGPLMRVYGGVSGGWIFYRDLAGIDGDELDELIARQVAFFAPHGRRFEWKHYGHDLPTDLPERLRAAGFRPEPTETVVIARVAEITGEPVLPDAVSLREVTERADFERIAAMEQTVWDEDHGWLPDMLQTELEVDADSLAIVVAESGDEVVCAGWIRYPRGTEFGTLWGGSTLPEWRRQGIYRATVVYRANLAAARGLRYLETDASDDSNPILQRLGFVPVTTTTPYVFAQGKSAQ